MRFYILSDLHLRAEVEAYKTSDRIKRLCSKIRQAADIGENILFIILGDIVDKGKELSFTTARDSLSLIQEELKDYAVKFEFVPGNHDLEKGSLSLFDQLTSLYGSKHTFESASVYSVVHDNVNFIYADSTLSRDYAAPGRLDLDAIRINVKHGLTNIFFTIESQRTAIYPGRSLNNVCRPENMASALNCNSSFLLIWESQRARIPLVKTL